MKTAIAINGAAGRMGRQVIHALLDESGARLSGGAVRPGSHDLGVDLGQLAGRAHMGVPAQSGAEAYDGADVVIDFATPDSLSQTLARLPQGCAYVCGVTGLGDAEKALLETEAQKRAVLWAGNFSLGVALLSAFVETAATALDERWDIEIAETHHRHKKDAPSGTALMLGYAAARGRKQELDKVAAQDRQGERAPGAIGFSVSRAGGTIGEHEVSFTSEHERLCLSHSAFDRHIFANGAVKAAFWMAGKPAGRYQLKDVLGL